MKSSLKTLLALTVVFTSLSASAYGRDYDRGRGRDRGGWDRDRDRGGWDRDRDRDRGGYDRGNNAACRNAMDNAQRQYSIAMQMSATASRADQACRQQPHCQPMVLLQIQQAYAQAQVAQKAEQDKQRICGF